MNATSRGRFFFSLISSGKGASGMRSSFRRRLMMSIADTRASAPRVARACRASHRGPVPRIDGERNFAIVPMGTLDDDPGMRPQAHIFVGSKAPWYEIQDELPQYEEYAPASVATDRPATANRPSAREPVDQGEHEADQAAHDGAVQPDELEIRAHAVLDLPHELLVAEPLEALAHREADLGVVAAEEVARGRPHPTVEGAAAAHVREELEDAGAQLAVDQRRERALPVGEVLLELLAQAGEHGADDRTGLDALEERAAQALGLC